MNRKLIYLCMALTLPCFAATEPVKADAAKAERMSYLDKANQEVREWAAKIQSLEQKSRESGSKVRQELDEQLAVVRYHFDDVRKGLRELSGTGDGAWTSLRKGLEESKEKLNRDYDKAVSTIKKTEHRVVDKKESK